jgi:predicted transcriptional regulator
MSRTPAPEVTDAELAVLQALWDLGPATIRQLTDRLYPAGSASCYATVQKLLERLEGKSFCTRDRSGPVHCFAACVGRDELIGRRLRTVAEKLCGGSLTPLLTHLVRAEKLSAADRAELRGLIDRLEADVNKRRGARKKD